MYLPYVKPETGCSVSESIDENESDKNYINKELEKIEIENPAVADFIRRWAAFAQNEFDMYNSAYCGILVYKLLQSQAEADFMNENFRV